MRMSDVGVWISSIITTSSSSLHPAKAMDNADTASTLLNYSYSYPLGLRVNCWSSCLIIQIFTQLKKFKIRNISSLIQLPHLHVFRHLIVMGLFVYKKSRVRNISIFIIFDMILINFAGVMVL
jgi:hypothetical protein